MPKDESALERCWPTQLVGRFKAWLGVIGEGGNAILQQILSRSMQGKLDALDADLKYEGIHVIPGVDRSSFARPTKDITIENGGDLSHNATPPRSTAGSNLSYNTTPPSSAARSAGRSSNESIPPQWSSPRAFSAQPRDDHQTQMAAYRKVLDSVIRAAQDSDILDMMDRQAPVPSIVVQTNTEELLVAFGQPLINGQQNWNRHKKVGAAGELFVSAIQRILQAQSG